MSRSTLINAPALRLVAAALALTLLGSVSYAQRRTGQQLPQAPIQGGSAITGSGQASTTFPAEAIATAASSTASLAEQLQSEGDTSNADGEEVVPVSIGGTQYVTPYHDASDAQSGDREFDGNGPHVVVRAQLFLCGKSTIMSQLTMTANETCPDSSFGVGASAYKTVYAAPQGYEIVEIVDAGAYGTGVSFTDCDHTTNHFVTEYGSVGINGDRSGDDLLSDADDETDDLHCQAWLEWDYDFQVKIKPRDDTYLVAPCSLQSKYVMRYKERRRGDGEFAGHGPSMSVNSQLRYNSDSVDVEFYGTASETGGDRSEADGYESFNVYRPPAGFRIRELRDGHGKPLESLTVTSTSSFDNRHQPLFRPAGAAGGIWRLFGDRKGSDLDGEIPYTRAELHGANYHLLVVLDPL